MKFEELLVEKPAGVQQVASQIRGLVIEELPTASEAVAAGKAQYWVDQPSNVLCSVEPRASHCLFFMHYITDPDSEVFSIEGVEAGTRHIAFTEALDPDEEAELRRLVHLAATRAEGGEVL